LHGCGTWSLILREEQRLKVFENRVLREIFEHKGEDVTGVRRKLTNEESHNSYSSPDINKVIRSRG
jgi:hypothetical protein